MPSVRARFRTPACARSDFRAGLYPLPSRARARRAPIPASCETELRRADRPARAGCAAADRRRRFLFSDFRFGATMEVGRSAPAWVHLDCTPHARAREARADSSEL